MNCAAVSILYSQNRISIADDTVRRTAASEELAALINKRRSDSLTYFKITGNMGNSVQESVFPAETPLAMAYVPFQKWEEPYAPNEALAAGTIFPSLDLPFEGSKSRKK